MFREGLQYFSVQDRLEIVKLLIEMRKRGLFQAIWCDADRLRVLLPEEEYSVKISWERAAQITGFESAPLSRAQNSALMQLKRTA